MRQQLVCLALGLLLSFFLISSFLLFVYFSQTMPEQTKTWSWKLLLWASIGGLFGGSARSLFMFIWEIGGKDKENVSFYLERWFLYLLKPFMGVATGVLFFLSVNLGLVSALTSEMIFEIPSIILVSSIGGIFFEEVFGILQERIRLPPAG